MSLLLDPELADFERLPDAYYAEDDPFAAAIRGTRMAMVVADCRLDDHPIVFVNDAFLALTGYERHEVLGRNCRFLQGPETDRDAVARLRAALDADREATVDLLNYRKDGSAFWNRLFVSPVRNSLGETLYVFGSQFDVTEAKREEQALREANTSLRDTVEARTEGMRDAVEQKTVLLHEVEHRVKNNLQLVSSLIQFQARGVDDPAVRAALEQVQERVSALAVVHRRLFQSDDAACFDVARFLADLADDTVARLGVEHVAIDLQVESARAPAAKAAPLALMLNEMLSHALRRGFPDGRAGRMAIVSRREGDSLLIELSDDGDGSADEARKVLGGGRSIAEILRRQLGARVSWSDNTPGLRARIELPLPA